jgi:hypothetical protein
MRLHCSDTCLVQPNGVIITSRKVGGTATSSWHHDVCCIKPETLSYKFFMTVITSYNPPSMALSPNAK